MLAATERKRPNKRQHNRVLRSSDEEHAFVTQNPSRNKLYSHFMKIKFWNVSCLAPTQRNQWTKCIEVLEGNDDDAQWQQVGAREEGATYNK